MLTNGLSISVAAQPLIRDEPRQWQIEPSATGFTVFASPILPAPPQPNVETIPAEIGTTGFILVAAA